VTERDLSKTCASRTQPVGGRGELMEEGEGRDGRELGWRGCELPLAAEWASSRQISGGNLGFANGK
jgi:hypothetical protein